MHKTLGPRVDASGDRSVLFWAVKLVGMSQLFHFGTLFVTVFKIQMFTNLVSFSISSLSVLIKN